MKNIKCLFGTIAVLLVLVCGIYASNEDCKCKQSKGNIFLGHEVATLITTGIENTFIGNVIAIRSTTASFNTVLGSGAGKGITTSQYNTILGHQAGAFCSSGSSNTFTGFKSGWYTTEGNNNTSIGFAAGSRNTTGNNNTYLGVDAGTRNSTGSGNVCLGYRAGYGETGSNKLYIANDMGNERVLIYGDFTKSKVGIANLDPEYALDLGGDKKIRGILVNPSDLRYKEDIRPIENALDKIINLHGVSFRWKDKALDNGEQLGFIGQEVEKVFPEVVLTDKKGYKSVGYTNLVAPLIEAVKELKAENDKLKARLETLEKKMKD
jgi:hypothetical protein